ncbi:ubiquitin carboxyl-terminal hydrolase [Aspergillus candidus]|uniref:Ubiquitin carboxyl-terminal hydrolase n=1 Tax=Aspergillus candidus TaxID=41067 RepID=A0A2I2FIH7_ASPCN|nr:cysteine proteinase [Aspergillus candidus]PLB40438.1 cysteine proteinase [Aspergillus candidus]
MSTSRVEYINGRKTFIPLENNPEIFTPLCQSLAISPTLTFHDVLSTTDPDLLALIPRPVNAVILCVEPPIYKAARESIAPTIPAYTSHGPTEPVFWARQTIGNACGLMAFLHCVLNLPTKDSQEPGGYVAPESNLATFLHRAVDLPPAERAQLLYNSQFLEDAHMAAAQRGVSHIPPSEEYTAHFVGFVRTGDGRVWELNGGLNGPFLRGVLPRDDGGGGGGDLLSEEGLRLTVGDFVDAARGVQGGMSVVAIAEE